MLTWFRKRSTGHRKAGELYGRVVTQARAPAIYDRHGVADTPEGRYEVLVLHLFLVIERLRGEGQDGAAQGRDLARDLVEVFVEDMDDSLREMGVGDLSVPRKVKKAAAGLYDRTPLYRTALGSKADDSLAEALATSLPAGAGRAVDSAALARYVRLLAAEMARVPVPELVSGTGPLLQPLP